MIRADSLDLLAFATLGGDTDELVSDMGMSRTISQ